MILLKSSRWWCYPYDVILLFLSFTASSFSILLISVPAFHCQAFWMLLLLLVLVWFSVSWQMLLFLTTSLFWKSVRSERYISLLYSPSSLPPFLPFSLPSFLPSFILVSFLYWFCAFSSCLSLSHFSLSSFFTFLSLSLSLFTISYDFVRKTFEFSNCRVIVLIIRKPKGWQEIESQLLDLPQLTALQRWQTQSLG